MSKIGPFFYIKNQLIYNSCSLAEGRRQANKIDNSYSHEQLFDKHFKSGDYINFPRGRVVWDDDKQHSIIYIDRCINRSDVISLIVTEFDIKDYVTEPDDHYRCKNCIRDLFDE